MRRVVLTSAAESDLEDIADYIARDSPASALRFVIALRDRCMTIGRLPDAAPLRPDLGDGVRVVVHGRYLILYAQRDGHVVIERVVHGSRNIDAALFEE